MGEQCEHGAPSSGCVDCLLEGRHAYAYAQGRADERAAVVAWLRGKAHDPTWLRAHGVQSRQGVCTLEEAADDIERGKHEVDAHQNDARAQEGEAVKKPRKTTPRERALVRAAKGFV